MTNVQYKDEFLDCVKQDLNNNYSEDERNLKLDLDFFEEQEIKNVFSSLFSASSVPNIFIFLVQEELLVGFYLNFLNLCMLIILNYKKMVVHFLLILLFF